MTKAINIRYLHHADMPYSADCGTLIATIKQSYKRIIGGEGIKENQYAIKPQIYVCKNCGLIQRVLNKEDLNKIEFV
jgi:hypothetical protein